MIGLVLKPRRNFLTVPLASISASLLFFLITNFGVWLDPTSFYPKGLFGLTQSYIMGLPFLKNTLMGDLFFTGILFLGYELLLKIAQKYLPNKSFKTYFA